jgi:2-hydroxychromene-2-carboxylate isomerase
MIEVFADVWCPYAHVGINRFVHQRWTAGRSDLTLRVRAWPLELVNEAPLDAQHVAEHVDDLRRQVAPHLFRGFDAKNFPHSTLPALELVDDAYEVSAITGECASLAVRHVLFERGDDITDPKVLRRLRRQLGVGPPRVAARSHVVRDWRDGQARGVVGSPHFFVNEHSFFCPTLEIERAGDHRQIRIDTKRFDEFFNECAAA